MKNIDLILTELFSERKIYERIDMKKDTWFKLKKRFENGSMTHEKKQELLRQFGYELVIPEQWRRMV